MCYYCTAPAPVRVGGPGRTQSPRQERHRHGETDVPALEMALVGSDQPLERSSRLREPSTKCGRKWVCREQPTTALPVEAFADLAGLPATGAAAVKADRVALASA